MGAADDGEEETGVGISRDDGGAVFTTGTEMGGGIEQKTGFPGGGTVTTDAMAGQERLDLVEIIRRGAEGCRAMQPEHGSDQVSDGAGHGNRMPQEAGK